MEQQISDDIITQQHCQACSKTIKPEDFFCENCGFPIRAPAEERDAFINNRNLKAFELAESEKKITSASNSIFVIGSFTALAGLFIYFSSSTNEDENFATMLINVVVAGLFIGLGFWCKKQPVAAIISALSLYGILWIFSIIENPLNIFKGIIIKVLIIGYLIKGLNSAFEAQRIKKTNNL